MPVLKMAQNKAKTNQKSNWRQADYGNKFTAKDVKQLASQGYTGNQILKIGSAASQMDQWKPTGKAMNRTSQALGNLNQAWLNPQTASGSVKGQPITMSMYPMRGKTPKKLLSWNGLGDSYRANPLSVFRPTGDLARISGAAGLFEDSGKKWFVPRGMRNATTFGSTMAPVAAAAPGAATGVGGEALPVGDMGGDYVPEDVPTDESSMSAQNGIGASLASYAAGWRQNKSARKRLGSAAQGLASQRVNAPWTTGFVGV